MSEKKTVTVEVDLSMHNRPPRSEREEIAWAALDTTWKLLRETATRLVLQDLRAQARSKGVEFPTDEVLFAAEPDNPDFPRSYLELAAEPEIAGRGLDAVLRAIHAQTMVDAAAGFDLHAAESEGGLDDTIARLLGEL